MGLQNSQMCPECVEMTDNGVIWYDTLRQNKQQKLGQINCREFKDVHDNWTECRLCDLARTALRTKDGFLPGFDTTIYYSRVLFARYRRRSALSMPERSSQGPQDEDSQICYTYRLRVTTNRPYHVEHTDSLDYIRQFQNQPTFSWPPPQGGEISLLCNKADTNSFANGRRMGGRLDFDLAKGWIDTCHTYHKHNKKDGYPHIRNTPNRVINVVSGKIERAHPKCLYAALSYCWGPPGTHQVQLDQETEKDLVSGGLYSQMFKIPQTILDATIVCKELGINYLWVDALCRHQGLSQRYRAERMREDITEIYQNSHLTIICEGGDSQHGLPGVNSSGERQVSMDVGNLSLAISKPSIDKAMHGSGWMRRLWTFDEYLQSRCCLIFSSSQVFFKCQHEDRVLCEVSLYEESAFDRVAIEDVDLPGIDGFWTKGGSGFQLYALLVGEYASRQVTNPKDWLLAFRGSERIMEAELGKDYIHGLPTTYFAQSLCFEIFDSERRSTPNFPSWSWQGWDISGSKIGYISFSSEWGFFGEIVTFYLPDTNLLNFGPVNTTIIGIPFTDIPSSDILEQLSPEEKRNVIAFSTLVVELCVSFGADGSYRLLLPGSETDFIAQASLNTMESYQVGSLVKCAFIGYCTDDRTEWGFYILIQEVRDSVSCRVGSCTVDSDD